MNNLKALHHVALIPDGNRRWAKERGLPTFEGHRRGFDAVKKIGKKARELEIPVFTVWAFSTENWKRDKKEVDYLMGIYEKWIFDYVKTALKDGIRIIHLGRKDRIPKTLKNRIVDAEEKTKHFTKYYLAVALDYGGRDEVLRAAQQIQKAKIKIQKEEEIDKYLYTKNLPYADPDLVIRTSGEQRISGFLIWQAAYAEYIFVKKHLPDFTEKDFEDCVLEYMKRYRRFGR